MRFSNIFKVSLTAIFRNKARSILTSLGIIIGVASVIMLVSIGNGIKKYVTSAFEDLGTNLLYIMPGKINFSDSREGGPPGTSVNKLTLDIADTLDKKVKYAKSVLPIMTTNYQLEYRAEQYYTYVIGTTPNYEDVRNSPVEEGRFFSNSESRRSAQVAVIGTTIVEELFGRDEPLGKEISVNDKKYTVIGILESKGSGMGNDQDDQIIVPITTLQKQTGADKLAYIYLEVADMDDLSKAQESVEEVLIKEGLDEDEFTATDPKELLTTVNQILSAITIGLGGIAAISLLVGGIGIMNIMLVSVTERTREIGLRKAVGARPQDILIQFLIEAVILSLFGGIVGILLGSLGSLALSSFIQTAITPWSVILAFSFAFLIGVLFGVWPARKASQLPPIEALRYE